MASRGIKTAFNGGEVAPSMWGRVDVDKYSTSLRRARNVFVQVRGGVSNRPGLRFVGEAKDSGNAVRLIGFQFSASQSYALEFGHQSIRVIKNGAYVLEAGKAISGATQAGHCVVTAPAHGFADGDEVYISGVVGMTELNGRTFRVTSSGLNSFRLNDLFGNPVVSTNFGAYVSGGTVARLYSIATPYVGADLFDLGYVQSNDVMTLTHPGYAPRKLSRLGDASWTLTTITFAPQISPPAAPTATPNGGGSGGDDYHYKVTAWIGGTESAATAPVTANTDFDQAGAYIDTTWAAVPGATDYFIYKQELFSTDFGYIGHATATSFRDTGLTPNGSVLAPTVPTSTPTPTGLAATAYNPALDVHQYVVTSISDTTSEESVASAASNSVGNDLDLDGHFNTITWAAVTGADRYNVYKLDNGVYGYIGGTTALSFKDDNIIADLSRGPPGQRNPFDGAGKYPSTTTFFEQRQVFAATDANPQTTWASNSALFENMNVSFPAKDNEAITFTIASRQADRIRHMIPMDSLILLTDGAEWKVNGGGNEDILTPSNIRPRPQSYFGCSKVRPITVGGVALFVDGAGKPRDLIYSFADNAYGGSDLTLLAPHFFPEDEVEGEDVEEREIVDWGYAQAPHGLIWAVRADGKLLCFTYLRDQSVFGWTLCETDGVFESACVVREGRRDVPYFVVRRTVNGQDKRYVERMEGRLVRDVGNAFFVDCGLSYSGDPVSSVGGLHHLEGRAVVALADGNVIRGLVVTGGRITFTRAYSRIHVGLAYESLIETLDLDPQLRDGTAQMRKKKVASVGLRVERSRGLWTGPTEDRLTEWKQRAGEYLGAPIDLYTGDIDIVIRPAWNSNGRFVVKQVDPLPMTILAALPEFENAQG